MEWEYLTWISGGGQWRRGRAPPWPDPRPCTLSCHTGRVTSCWWASVWVRGRVLWNAALYVIWSRRVECWMFPYTPRAYHSWPRAQLPPPAAGCSFMVVPPPPAAFLPVAAMYCTVFVNKIYTPPSLCCPQEFDPDLIPPGTHQVPEVVQNFGLHYTFHAATWLKMRVR